jgi:hypothetical protein
MMQRKAFTAACLRSQKFTEFVRSGGNAIGKAGNH